MNKPNADPQTPRERALDLDRNISVTAGAGSGKTRILVDRFLKIVTADPGKVRRILTITFTEKAAGELQERIAGEMDDLLQSAEDAQRHNDLLYIRDHLNSAYISTIHGFCSRILHEFPLESGLSPDFHVMDEIEQTVIVRQAIRTLMEQIDGLEIPEEQHRYYEFFSRVSRYRIEEMLEKALSTPFDMERLFERFDGWSDNDFIKHLCDLWAEVYDTGLESFKLAPFADQVEGILHAVQPEPVTEKGIKAFHLLHDFHHQYLDDPESLATRGAFINVVKSFTTGNATAYKNLGQLGGKADWSAENADRILALSALCREPAVQLQELDPGLPPSEVDREWFHVMTTFFRLYRMVKNSYDELKAESGRADFDDLQMRMLSLMEDETVQRELHGRFDAIMVDEFQDTDQLQWQIISRLAVDNGKLDRKKLFIVGDPKQSIYGFRNADIRVFRDVKHQFAAQAGYETEADYPGNITFAGSYRFLPRLNAFINHLFSHVLRESEHNEFEVGYHPLISRRDVPGSGSAQIALFTDAEDAVSTECRYMAQTIARLKEDETEVHIRDKEEVTLPVRYGDIAILIRSRTHLLSIEQALRSAGIPFKTVGGIGFWQRQEIYDFYYLLRFLNNTADDLSLVAVLRSRFFMVPDTTLYAVSRASGRTFLEKLQSADCTSSLFSDEDRPWINRAVRFIEKWLQFRERIPLSELLFTIIQDTSLKTILSSELNGEQLASNLDKLVALAQSFDASGLGGLNEFMTHIDDLISREIRESEALIDLEDDHTVKIMTIHASKGLQFPVVFVPFLNTSHGGPRDSVLINPDLGVAAKIRQPGSGMESIEHTLYRLIRIRESQKESAEAKRLFYVAVSRASDRLYLSAALKKDKVTAGSPLSWMQSCFDSDDVNLMEDEMLVYDDFHIDIQRQLSEPDDQGLPPVSFLSKLDELESVVETFQLEPQTFPMQLLPMDSPITGRVFSATMIMTYLDNPNAYYARYHLGFFESDYESFGSGRTNEDHSLLLGQMVHRFLEKCGVSRNPDAAVLDQLFFEFDVLDPTVRTFLQSELESILTGISTSESARRILGAGEYRNEVNVTMKLGEDYLTGTLDRIVCHDSGLWEIVDYKTNRITAGTVTSTAQHYEWQIKTYALLLSRLFPEQDVFPVSLYFIRPDVVHQTVFTHADIEQISGVFGGIIQKIKNELPVQLP